MRSNNNNREAAENRGECEDRRKGKKYEEKLSISSILKLCYCSTSLNKSSTSNSFFMLTSALLFVRLYAFT
jgi:hypothetical protein